MQQAIKDTDPSDTVRRWSILHTIIARHILACPVRQASILCSIRSLDISRTSAISSAHRGGLTCLAIELAESRYLLASATDSSVAIYDTARATLDPEKNGCICSVDRNTPGGHRFSVSTVTWYPVDHGLFVTGSTDTDVNDVAALLLSRPAHRKFMICAVC